MSIFRNTSNSPMLWAGRAPGVKQDLQTLEQLVEMHKQMLELIEELDKMADKRLFPAKELVKRINALRDSANFSLTYLALDQAP